MCRLAFYLGPQIAVSSLVTEPVHSIIHQSYHAKERPEPLNGDGFGIGWYAPEFQAEPAVFREVQPAWSSVNLKSLAPVARSECILAHVRAASSGLSVGQLNCHPFTHGRYSFMHNGEVAGFLATRRTLLNSLSDAAFGMIKGSTDSEVMFALIMDRLGADPAQASLDQLAEVMLEVIHFSEQQAIEINSDEPAYLNLVLTDGQRAVVSRYVTEGAAAQSLYCHRGAGYRCENGICYMDQTGRENQAILLSSEPLSQDDGWESVTENSLMLIDQNRQITQREINPIRSL